MTSPARLAVALVVLAALCAAPVLAGAAPAGAPAAHAAKARCRARGHARARHCRRATRRRTRSGGVPRPFNPLWSADRSLRVLVSYQQERGRRPIQIVEVRAGNVPVTCPTSGALRSLIVVQVPLRGSSFSGSQTDSSGGVRRVDGHFVSATKAVGTFEARFPDIRGGGDCVTGSVSFTATR